MLTGSVPFRSVNRLQVSDSAATVAILADDVRKTERLQRIFFGPAGGAVCCPFFNGFYIMGLNSIHKDVATWVFFPKKISRGNYIFAPII
jgi:poly(A) polymerase Pap1